MDYIAFLLSTFPYLHTIACIPFSLAASPWPSFLILGYSSMLIISIIDTRDLS